MSSIKLGLLEPSIRKSENKFSRDLILAVRRPMVITHKTKEKFQPKWEGLFVVESVYLNKAYRLITPNGDTLMMPINDRFLKKYYPQRDFSHDQVNITPLMKALRSKMSRRAPKKSIFLQRITSQSIDAKSNEHY